MVSWSLREPYTEPKAQWLLGRFLASTTQATTLPFCTRHRRKQMLVTVNMTKNPWLLSSQAQEWTYCYFVNGHRVELLSSHSYTHWCCQRPSEKLLFSGQWWKAETVQHAENESLWHVHLWMRHRYSTLSRGSETVLEEGLKRPREQEDTEDQSKIFWGLDRMTTCRNS